MSMPLQFEAMALAMPDIEGHPNRMPFSGVLTRIDEPSDAPPGGAGGSRTLIPKAVAESALPSLLGMAVDFKPDFDGHDAQSKIGLITEANIVGNAIQIAGYFYQKDFPDECARLKAEKAQMGFSFECDASAQNIEGVLVIDYLVFTGAAVLYKHLAAYTTTSLAAQAESQDNEMTREELLAIFAEANKPITEKLNAMEGKLTELEAKGASLGGPIVDQVKPHVDALNAAADGMERAGIGDDPRSGHAGVVRQVAAHMAAAAVSGKVPKVYRDHDYLPDASVEAAAASGQNSQIDALSKKLDDLGTVVTDIKAAAFQKSEAPARSTIDSNVVRLLAKGGLSEAQINDKLSVDQVDTALEAAGVKGKAAIEAKLKLMSSGRLPVQR